MERLCKWIRVENESDLPKGHLFDTDDTFVTRIYHDDRGSHIEELTIDEIWEASQVEDGAVLWLNEGYEN